MPNRDRVNTIKRQALSVDEPMASIARHARHAVSAGPAAAGPEMKSFLPHYTAADMSMCQKIIDWLGDAGVSNTRANLQRATGLSAGTVTQVLSGQYPSPPTPHLEAMWSVVDRAEARNREPSSIPFTPTSVSAAVSAVIRRAHTDRDFGIFAGRVGIGKSMALRQYHAEQRQTSVLIEAFPGAGAAVVMRLLATRIGAPQRRRTIADITATVVETLRGRDTVLLIDEAETLTDQALLHLRRVSDAAGVGVVLVGTPNLTGLVYDPDGKFGQITSRIGFWPAICQSISSEDVKALVSAFDPSLKINSDTLLALAESCQGSARALRNLLRNSSRHCRRAGKRLDADIVRQIDKQTMGGRRLAA